MLLLPRKHLSLTQYFNSCDIVPKAWELKKQMSSVLCMLPVTFQSWNQLNMWNRGSLRLNICAPMLYQPTIGLCAQLLPWWRGISTKGCSCQWSHYYWKQQVLSLNVLVLLCKHKYTHLKNGNMKYRTITGIKIKWNCQMCKLNCLIHNRT